MRSARDLPADRHRRPPAQNKKAEAVLNGFGFFALRGGSAAKRACMFPVRVGPMRNVACYWAGAAGFL